MKKESNPKVSKFKGGSIVKSQLKTNNSDSKEVAIPFSVDEIKNMFGSATLVVIDNSVNPIVILPREKNFIQRIFSKLFKK